MYKKILLVALVLVGISSSGYALAGTPRLDPTGVENPIKAGDIDLVVPIPNGPNSTITKVPSDPADYFRLIFLYGIGLAALLAFAQLAFGAVQYTASAGFPALQESSKSRMRDAVIGLILLIGAVTILLMIARPGQRELAPLEKNSTPAAAATSARTATDEQYSSEQEYKNRYNGTLWEMRQTWDKWWKSDPTRDPGDKILIQKLVENLQEIEDASKYNWATNEAGRAGYLAARRDMFRQQALLTDGGGVYKKAPGLYSAYVNSRKPNPLLFPLEARDAPQP